MCFRRIIQILSWLLYDLSKPGTRSCGFSMSTDLWDSDAPRSQVNWWVDVLSSQVRHRADFEPWTSCLSNLARRGHFLFDEPQSLFIIRQPWRFVSVCGANSAPILENAFSALERYANKTNGEAPYSSRQAINLAQFFVEMATPRPSILTPNAPMSGAGVRSTQASAPLAGVRPAWA